MSESGNGEAKRGDPSSDPSGGEQSTPEGPGQGRARVHPALLGVSVLVGTLVAVGLGFMLGRLTVPEETPATLAEAAPTTQPVPTTVEPASPEPSGSGPALSWEPTDVEISAGHVAGIVEFQGRFLTYTSDFGVSGTPSGVSLWSSVDGKVWSDEGVVIPAPAFVTGVFAADDRMLAFGSLMEGDIAGPFGPSGGSPAVWTSTDGTTWQQHELPIPTEFEQQAIFGGVQAGAATSDVGIAVGYVESSIELAVMEALPPEVRELMSQPGLGFGIGGPPFSVQIQGPFGITVYSATFEELGIDPELVREEEESMGGGMQQWTTTDFQTWSMSDAEPFGPEDSVHNFVVGPNGDLVAFGYGRRGPTLWRSNDGVTWTATQVRAELSELAVRGEAFISSESTGFDAAVVRSLDGETWDPITPDDLLSADFMWQIDSVSAADYGIAASANGYGEEGFMEGEPPVVVISKDGMTVTFDDMRGAMIVSGDDGVLLEVPLFEEGAPEGVTYNLETSTLSFADPESGEVLITLTLEEIQQAEQQAFGDVGMSREETVILFSQDETSWNVQSIGEAFGVEQAFPRLFVFDDFVLAAVQESDRLSVFEDADSAPPPTRIWIGILP